MTDIRKLIETMARQEEDFRRASFVAPCVRGGKVRAKVGGIAQAFVPRPSDFDGWGVFQAEESGTARLVEAADLPLIAGYLSLFPALRAWLARPLSGSAWLAYPANEGDMRQRFGAARPLAVHLVTEGAAFERVVVRGAGGVWWFEEPDRRTDPQAAERLRDALRAVTPPTELRGRGITPEMRTAYDLAAQADERFVAQRRAAAERQWREDRERLPGGVTPRRAEGRLAGPQDRNAETRLRGALGVGGGELRDFNDRGDYWLVEWSTRSGERHTSAIAKADLTVVSSGVCLSGRDRDFDLQSLVGVIEKGTWYDW